MAKELGIVSSGSSVEDQTMANVPAKIVEIAELFGGPLDGSQVHRDKTGDDLCMILNESPNQNEYAWYKRTNSTGTAMMPDGSTLPCRKYVFDRTMHSDELEYAKK